jgi:CRP-like cAMP-binding protein
MMSNNTNTRNHLLSALPEEELSEFRSSLTQVSLSHKQIIHERNTPIDHVYFIEHGITSVLTVMSNGEVSEVGMIGTEGMVGMSALLGAEASAQRIIVQVPGSALRMNAALCKASFDRRPAFHRTVLRFVDTFLSLSAQTAACNLLHSAEQRCARWLLMASARMRSDAMPMTHEFLSSMLGIRRTGVTAIAGALQRAGLIQYRRGRIRITNRDGLISAACECYRLDRERIGGPP